MEGLFTLPSPLAMANDQLAIEAHHRKVANPFSFSFKTEQTSTQNQRKPKKTLVFPSFMGFPVGYSDLLFPKLIFQLIFFLNFLRRLISSIFAVAGLSHLIESDAPWPDANIPPELCSASAILIQEILPVVRFDELLKGQDEGQLRPFTDGCAVCLFEFEEREEVRWLSNCRHVFHRGCLDQWVDHDQRTCPLCRTLLIPEEMQEAFDRRIWASAGVDGSFAGGEFDDSSTSVSPP